DAVHPLGVFPAAIRQPRVEWRREVVRRPVRRLNGQVARHVLAIEPALVVLDLYRNSRSQLLLDGDTDLRVPRPVLVEQLIAVDQPWIQRPEIVVAQTAAEVPAAGDKILAA